VLTDMVIVALPVTPESAISDVARRRRGHTAGQLLVGLTAAQLAGEDFLVGLDRQRATRPGSS